MSETLLATVALLSIIMTIISGLAVEHKLTRISFLVMGTLSACFVMWVYLRNPFEQQIRDAETIATLQRQTSNVIGTLSRKLDSLFADAREDAAISATGAEIMTDEKSRYTRIRLQLQNLGQRNTEVRRVEMHAYLDDKERDFDRALVPSRINFPVGQKYMVSFNITLSEPDYQAVWTIPSRSSLTVKVTVEYDTTKIIGKCYTVHARLDARNKKLNTLQSEDVC